MKWCLMIDADDTLEGGVIDGKKLNNKLAVYSITIKHNTLVHDRMQLFNMAFDWRYRGAVHEYPDCRTIPWTSELFSPSTWIQARTEGARSNDSQKYHKDALMLLEELKKPDCDKARTLFYLAQSFRDSDNKEQAIKYYHQRIDLQDSWVEERYVSYLNLIRLTNSIDDKIKYAWKAQHLLPTRKECVGEVLHYARIQDIFTQELYAMGLVFKNVTLPERGLFLEPLLYGWMYDEDFGLESYFTNHFQEAYDSLKLSYKHCPDWAKDIMKRNVRNAWIGVIKAAHSE